MMPYDRITLGRQAKQYGFVRDTFEKVCRLADILRMMENDALLSTCLALKGGTAINLTIFALPRLSVDIDLDFTENVARSEMLTKRAAISERIAKYMEAGGYRLSDRSKTYHALDSFVYTYQNAAGMSDNLKIEINYMLRCHVLPTTKQKVALAWLDQELHVLSVAPVEIFASKIVALLFRTAPRDLYDIHNMLHYGLFDESEQALLRKCVLFYSAIGTSAVPERFSFEALSHMPQYRIKADLTPVLRSGVFFDVHSAQAACVRYLSELLVPTQREASFLEAFRNQDYRPELLFEDAETVERLRHHPMALWKCGDKGEG